MAAKKKVFIADDEEVIIESLQKMFILSGFEVDSAKEAKDVVAKIKTFKPDVVLLDLLMPHLGGFEICEILNGDKETQGIPIIVISALAGQTDIKKAYKLGVIGYFTKPFDFQKLLHDVNKAIEYKSSSFEPLL